jgi:hypothetical protein
MACYRDIFTFTFNFTYTEQDKAVGLYFKSFVGPEFMHNKKTYKDRLDLYAYAKLRLFWTDVNRN